jgi:hypothetical protein
MKMTLQHRSLWKVSLARVSSASGLLLILWSCSALQPLQPTARTAVVKAGPWGKVYRGGYVELAAISGGDVRWRLRSEVELTPGVLNAVYYVYLCTQADKNCTSIAEAQGRFTAQAGHTYQVRAQEQGNGSNRFWVWVIDETDGRSVGGTTPGETPEGASHESSLLR